ncbi:MAG TPA: DUF1553 domain-containing protein [Planctomycetaceae bacterium]|nr:DUF1553 domain-containing protein [Planctomycetaceae bacterium]
MLRPLRLFGLFVLPGLAFLCHAAPPETNDSEQGEPAKPLEAKGHWSFQPVRQVVPPAVRERDWPTSTIDQFILAGLESRGIAPAPPADKRTLLRRVTFDLTGLPPTPEEIQGFLADDSPAAYARVVDRLLASPAYGERWGRHWLDVVRYADARDLIQLPAESDFREAWRYRDWVVAAFNGDLPYDEFIRKQIAGDLLQPADPDQIDADSLVATGLLALADFVPGDVDKEQMIADYVNDQIDVLGRAVLGLTLGCARCHDHKYDPVTIEDYYALAGIFFSTRLIPGPVKGNTPLVRVPLMAPARIQRIEAEAARDKERQSELSREISRLEDREFRTIIERQITAETPRYLVAGWDFLHSGPANARPATADFARARALDETIFANWIKSLDEKPLHPALIELVAATDRAAVEKQADAFKEKLSAITDARRTPSVGPASPSAQLLCFRADDRKIVTNDARRITLWPDRAASAEDAMPVPETPAPFLASAIIAGQVRPVVRFPGQELLQAARSVPATGSLFAVCRPDPTSAGQRLIGWEDSSAGKHGIGLMTVAGGGLHAVVRRNGANGDVVASGSDSIEFQIVCLTWGPEGVSLFRDGQLAGTNKGIDNVSSDPAITALRIGGPGSGSSSRFQGDLCELRVYATPLHDEARTRVEAELRQRWLSSSADATAAADPIADLYEELLSSRSPYWIGEADRRLRLPAEVQSRLAAWRDELETLKKKPPVEIPRAVVVQEGGPADTKHAGFQDAHVYLRGNPANPGKIVPRGFPHALAGNAQPPIETGSGRRELARWLTSPDHPLTARVMVNRVWQHHFGNGLVRTSTNFGLRGEPPTHPELLDDLAGRFVASGWSVKALQRMIVLSSAYQQSTQATASALAADPENRWLGRVNRRRLEAEAIRDTLFAVAGRLDRTPGGPGFLEADKPRRSLYLMSVRTGAKAAEFCPLFDGPDGGGVIERRNQSIVAPQALFLMNDPLVNDLATALAERVRRDVPDDARAERIHRLYEIALGRPPTAHEIEIGRQLVADPRIADPWPRYCLVLLCTNELVYVD